MVTQCPILWTHTHTHTRRLSKRISEQVPATVHKRTIRIVISVILHLAHSDHRTDPSTVFKSIQTTPRFHTKGLRGRLHVTLEIFVIWLLKRELCKQYNLVQVRFCRGRYTFSPVLQIQIPWAASYSTSLTLVHTILFHTCFFFRPPPPPLSSTIHTPLLLGPPVLSRLLLSV